MSETKGETIQVWIRMERQTSERLRIMAKRVSAIPVKVTGVGRERRTLITVTQGDVIKMALDALELRMAPAPQTDPEPDAEEEDLRQAERAADIVT